MVDFVKSLLGDFDPTAFLPDLWAIFDNLDVALRVLVLAGPLCLLGLGLLYLLAPPAEARHIFGYRLFWGMSSVEAWQYTQKTAGLVWLVLGLGMTVSMAFICNSYRDLEYEAAIWSAIEALGVERVLILASIVAVNIAVFVAFDRKGDRRNG